MINFTPIKLCQKIINHCVTTTKKQTPKSRHHVHKVDNDFATHVFNESCNTDVLIIMLGNIDHLEM